MGLIDSIIGAESGGNPNAVNPRSSATGAGQFLAATWIDTLSRNRPDLVQGKSPEQILALRNDPQLSRQMTEAYANQNQGILTKNGLPVTPGSTYLAHFAGPGGAVKVLQADPNAPVEAVLGPAVVKANPFLAGMTARDLQGWADRKMGGNSQPAQRAPVSPASPSSAPLQVAPQAPLTFSPQPQQQASQPAPIEQIPQMQAPPIFAPPRKPIDLSKLMAAFKQPNFYRG